MRSSRQMLNGALYWSQWQKFDRSNRLLDYRLAVEDILTFVLITAQCARHAVHGTSKTVWLSETAGGFFEIFTLERCFLNRHRLSIFVATDTSALLSWLMSAGPKLMRNQAPYVCGSRWIATIINDRSGSTIIGRWKSPISISRTIKTPNWTTGRTKVHF